MRVDPRVRRAALTLCATHRRAGDEGGKQRTNLYRAHATVFMLPGLGSGENICREMRGHVTKPTACVAWASPCIAVVPAAGAAAGLQDNCVLLHLHWAVRIPWKRRGGNCPGSSRSIRAHTCMLAVVSVALEEQHQSRRCNIFRIRPCVHFL